MVIKRLPGISLALGLASAALVLLMGDFFHPQPLPSLIRKPVPPETQVFKPFNFEQLNTELSLAAIHQVETLGQLEPLSAPVTFPFQYEGDHVLVDARVNNTAEPLRFVLDSGVRSLILDRHLSPSLGLEPIVRFSSQGTYGLLNQVSIAGPTFLKSEHSPSISALPVNPCGVCRMPVYWVLT